MIHGTLTIGISYLLGRIIIFEVDDKISGLHFMMSILLIFCFLDFSGPIIYQEIELLFSE